MSKMATVSQSPHLEAAQKKLAVPILVNAYGWLWLNRKGEPTSVSQEVYRNLLGPDSTATERRELSSRSWPARRSLSSPANGIAGSWKPRGKK